MSATATCVHETGKYHIDALAVDGASSLAAIATSSLTGDIWDGGITLLALEDGTSARTVHTAPTQSGNAGLAWVGTDVLAVGDDCGDVSLWSVATSSEEAKLTELARFGEHMQPITALAACTSAPARVASTCLDGTAKVWSATVAGGAIVTLEHLAAHAWCEVAALSLAWLDASAHALATGASDGVVRIWDVRQEHPAASRFAPHSASILALARGAAEDQLLAASECGSLLLLDKRRPSAPVLASQLHPSAPLCALSTVAAGAAPLIAVGAEDGSVAAVDPRDLHVSTTCAAHASRVAALAWHAPPESARSGGALLSGGWDKRLVRVTLPPPAGVALAPE